MRKMKLRTKIIISILTIFISLYCLFILANTYVSTYSPTLTMFDLKPILSKTFLNTNDYSLIYSQTGLSKLAVDEILDRQDGINSLLAFQRNYFEKINVFSEKVNPFTVEEYIMVNGAVREDNLIAPLKNGDILLTKSVHTMYWRHGHCGIVIDAENGVVLESLTPGTISKKQSITKWQHYPTLKILRLKDADQKQLDEIAKFAEENLIGIKYKILAFKRYDNKNLSGENCSQMIWQAFKRYGYDLDSNKGILVTPEDIAKSDLLEVVQIYGFNPQKDW